MTTEIWALISLLIVRIVIPVSLTLAVGALLGRWDGRRAGQMS